MHAPHRRLVTHAVLFCSVRLDNSSADLGEVVRRLCWLGIYPHMRNMTLENLDYHLAPQPSDTELGQAAKSKWAAATRGQARAHVPVCIEVWFLESEIPLELQTCLLKHDKRKESLNMCEHYIKPSHSSDKISQMLRFARILFSLWPWTYFPKCASFSGRTRHGGNRKERLGKINSGEPILKRWRN